MKRTLLTAILFSVALSSSRLSAKTSQTSDLDGRELVVRIYRPDPNVGATSEKKTVRIEGKTFRLALNDLAGATGLAIVGREQKDEFVRRQIGRGSQSYYTWEGPRFRLPIREDELKDNELVIRVYDRWAEKPGAYRKKPLRIEAGGIKFSFDDVDESAVVAIFGQDQDDEQLREHLGWQVFGWTYRQGLTFSLPRKPAADSNGFCWTFVDALGEPLPNGNIRMYLVTAEEQRVFIDEGIADANAQFKTPFNVSGADAQIGVRHFGSTRPLFVFSHPRYGVAEGEVFRPRESGYVVTLPVVPAESKANTRCAWGTVVDANGNPVVGASVEASGLQLPGGETISRCRHCWVRTDQQGRFRVYMPVSEDEQKMGILIPPKSQYTIRVTPPKGLGMLAYYGRIPNGEESIITLECPAMYFHKFAFEDENGPISDPTQLRGIRLTIDRPGKDKPALRPEYQEWKNGGVFPLGTYRAVFSGGRFEEYSFGAIEVTADSPEQLVFTVPKDRVYYGHVVNGFTSEPMEGVFVGDSDCSSCGRNLSQLTPEQWQALHSLPASVSLANKEFAKVVDPVPYCFSKVVRTDRDGRFEIRPSKREFYKLVIFQQHYMTVITDKRKCSKEDKNTFKVPLTRLFPAAVVVAEPWIEGREGQREPSLWPECILQKESGPAWVHDLLAAWDVEGSTFMDDIRNDFCLHLNEPHRFPVPAGLYTEIQLRPRYGDEKEWAPVTITEGVRLKQGQVLDLGRVQIQPTVTVFAEVVNSAGQPLEGVPVQAIDKYGTKTSNTDEEGMALLYLAPDSTGQFVVEYRESEDPGAVHLRDAIPYEIRGSEDANTVFTLELSDEMLYHLFK